MTGDDSDVVMRGGRAFRVDPDGVGEDDSLELAGESMAGERGRGTLGEEVISGVCFIYASMGDPFDDPDGVGLNPSAGLDARAGLRVAALDAAGAKVGGL